MTSLAPFRARRPAYTLLEVLLAMAIGVILLGALYVALDVQLRYSRAGRNLVQSSTLARTLFDRIVGDITPELGPAAPASTSGGAGSSGASPSASSAGGTGSSSPSATQAMSSTTNSAVTFNLGVHGDNQNLYLYVSRWPQEINQVLTDANDSSAVPMVSDLRRITYWLSGDPGSAAGLCRQEIKVATSDDALNSTTADLGDDPSFIIASEVRNANFQYFDGQQWQDSWDGTTLGSDGKTPIGPPVAIAITLDIALPREESRSKSEPATKQYRHVVFLPTANGSTTASSSSSTTGGGASP